MRKDQMTPPVATRPLLTALQKLRHCQPYVQSSGFRSFVIFDFRAHALVQEAPEPVGEVFFSTWKSFFQPWIFFSTLDVFFPTLGFYGVARASLFFLGMHPFTTLGYSSMLVRVKLAGSCEDCSDPRITKCEYIFTMQCQTM